MGEEVERRNSELEREVTGLRNSYWTERKARLAAEAQVEAMRMALEGVREAIANSDEPEALAIIRHALASSTPESSLQKMQNARAEEIACQNPQGCCCVIDGPPWVCPYDQKAAPQAEESSVEAPELTAELRARANARHTGEGPSPTAQLCARAADRIEALEAENFKLAAGVCRWVTGNEHGNAYCGDTGKLL